MAGKKLGLQRAANERAKQKLKERTLGDLSFDASRYEEFEDEYPLLEY